MIRIRRHSTGFTFVEVLVAMLILVLASLAASSIARQSVRATRDAKEISRASWLLQKVMTELETRLETEGLEKGCDKKKEGKFDAPDADFSWVTYCYEIDVRLSETAAQATQADEDSNESTKEDVITKMILQTANKYIASSLRELTAEVIWKQGKGQRTVSATTHFVRYDQPLTFPSIAGGLGQ